MNSALLIRLFLIRISLVSIGLFVAGSSVADVFPSKPIKIVVPFAPGGSGDIAARVIGQEMSKNLGQPIIVEPRPGAGANIGGAAVAKAPADGYTLLFGAVNNFSVNQHGLHDQVTGALCDAIDHLGVRSDGP